MKNTDLNANEKKEENILINSSSKNVVKNLNNYFEAEKKDKKTFIKEKSHTL